MTQASITPYREVPLWRTHGSSVKGMRGTHHYLVVRNVNGLRGKWHSNEGEFGLESGTQEPSGRRTSLSAARTEATDRMHS
jgi:hypothetical protein